ncbi:MAG: DUF4382 domain-containing protein [Cyclobacteriaceae bacterium]|nr:DUF4382 domain-containing protein [Cyclobacteriaceae bacterium]
MKFVRLFSLALLSAVMLISCSEDGRNARLEIRLTDAPGDYEEVNIDIQGVQVHAASEDNGSGWKSLDITPGVYNLLELTNGLDTLLGVIELPAGRISQVRLILGNNNTLKINGETKALTTPSAQQSGLKLNVHADLVEGITYTLLLDFDAARSIVKAGASGKYLLKPVIRTITEATSGAVAGTVSEPLSKPAVYAIIANDTLGTTFANDEGKFMIKGLQPGTYTISFSPATGYSIEDIADVDVTLGNVTNLGEVAVITEQ